MNPKIDFNKPMGGDERKDCFAYQSENHLRLCTALKERHCHNCPFYKSRSRMAQETLRCSERLKNVSPKASLWEYELAESYGLPSLASGKLGSMA